MGQLRLGTRGSKLALWQAQHVAELLRQKAPGLEVHIEVIKTAGDKILDVSLASIGDKGLFTKEIESALLDKKVDLAVHSMKDLPSVLEPGLCLGAVLNRENPQDVLLSPQGLGLHDLPRRARVGTSSLRRIAQLKANRPDLEIVDLRGNVDTRIRKMYEQGLDAIVLAYAGVKRLGYDHLITEVISCQELLPAVGQGALGVEIRSGDQDTAQITGLINHEPTRLAIMAERSFLRVLEGGCQVPVGALSEVAGGRLQLSGLVASLDGTKMYRETLEGSVEQGEELGQSLAGLLLQRGADKILAEIRRLGEQL
jgi:hydroxymethylbilane synthase